MAHEVDSAAFSLLGAWHGLGEVADHVLNADDAYAKVMDWTVEESEALSGVFAGSRSATAEWKMLRRSDNGGVLSIVRSSYEVLQNTIVRDVANELAGVGGVQIESALSLYGGRKVMMLARSESLDIGRGDEVVPYHLIATAHDGSMGLISLPTTIRVVCANTYAAAMRGTNMERAFTWRHAGSIGSENGRNEILAAVRDWKRGIDSIANRAAALAKRSVSREEVQSLWADVYAQLIGPIPTETEAAENKGAKRRRENAAKSLGVMATIFDAESAAFGANAWVAANAASNWYQHHRDRRADQESRVDWELFGGIARDTRSIFDRTEQLLGV